MNPSETRLLEQLTALKLVSVQQHFADLASEAAQKQWTHVDYLARLIELEATRRQELSLQRRIAAAQAACRLKAELKRFLAPAILCIDEVGCLPIDKTGADLLFQVISQRYDHGSSVLTTKQAYKHWAKIFNNDSTLTSAVLDRLLHHAETVIIEGKSYRMKDQIEAP